MSENKTNVNGTFIPRDMWTALSQLEPAEIVEILNIYSDFVAWDEYEPSLDGLSRGGRAMLILLMRIGRPEVI